MNSRKIEEEIGKEFTRSIRTLRTMDRRKRPGEYQTEVGVVVGMAIAIGTIRGARRSRYAERRRREWFRTTAV